MKLFLNKNLGFWVGPRQQSEMVAEVAKRAPQMVLRTAFWNLK